MSFRKDGKSQSKFNTPKKTKWRFKFQKSKTQSHIHHISIALISRSVHWISWQSQFRTFLKKIRENFWLQFTLFLKFCKFCPKKFSSCLRRLCADYDCWHLGKNFVRLLQKKNCNIVCFAKNTTRLASDLEMTKRLDRVSEFLVCSWRISASLSGHPGSVFMLEYRCCCWCCCCCCYKARVYNRELLLLLVQGWFCAHFYCYCFQIAWRCWIRSFL